MKTKTYSISILDNVYLVKLIDKKMKTIRLKIENNDIIISGYHINEIIANDFINKHQKWIINNINKNKVASSNLRIEDYNNFKIFYLLGNIYDINLSDHYFEINNDKFKYKELNIPKIHKALRNHYKYLIEERVNKLKPLFNHDCEIIYKDMKSRYGYCNVSRNMICLSLRLIHLPVDLIDYVIVHEFCHFKVQNHQKEFYEEMKKYYPLYKSAKSELKKYSQLMK